MKDIILFSQAPADIQYVLSLYDKYKDDCSISIVVVNVKNNYIFLNTLHLNARIEFIPLVGQSDLIAFLKFSIELRTIYKKIFTNILKSKVYFFSNNYDYVTAYCIKKLLINHNNDIYFYDIYKIDGNAIVKLSTIIKSILIKILFGIKIKFFNIANITAYQYMYDKNKVIKIDLKVNNAKLLDYKYNIKELDNNKKNLLFFESNGEIDKSFSNYRNNLIAILGILADNYNIYIKPHPRLGYSKTLDHYNILVIYDYIPSELVHMDIFDIVIGIDSASIATSTHQNKYSLINLFEFSDEKRKTYLKTYLDNLADTELTYINDIKEILCV